MKEILLKINGKTYSGWTSIHVVQSINQLSGNFMVKGTNPYPNKPETLDIRMGYDYELYYKGSLMMTGFVEDYNISYSGDEHSIEIGGRDVTGDLVDCSHTSPPAEWQNITAVGIIRTICENSNKFNIPVVVDGSVLDRAYQLVSEKVTPNEGETVYDLIRRICKLKAMLAISYGDGKLTLTEAGTVTAKDAIVAGYNALSGRLTQSNRERFSAYIVKGQGEETVNKVALDYTAPVGIYLDAVINRWRPLVMLADGAVDSKTCKDMAAWETRIRAGRSRMARYEVRGWTQSNGGLWKINTLVKVRDPHLGLEGQYLITDLEFMGDDSTGFICGISITNKQAYEIILTKSTQSDEIHTKFDPLTMESQEL